MNAQKIHPHAVCLGILVGMVLAGVGPAGAAVTTNIFTTRFEATEGYSTATNLVGQNGWLGFGSGGNGLVSDYFTNQGQQAYIGYFAPNSGDDQLVVWRPINFSPIPTNVSLVQFSVLMSIVDSFNTNYDNFYWSVYNAEGDRLFTLDFDNYDLGIYYALDGTNEFVWTEKTFTNDDPKTLVISLDFAQNAWAATLEGVLLATNQPITTTGVPRNLGDVDAVWVVYDAANPGDNYMLFDNYQITAEIMLPLAPHLQNFHRDDDGQFRLRVVGQSGARFAIDATTNLSQWTALKTNVITDGYFDYVDSSAPALARRFYRARWVP